MMLRDKTAVIHGGGGAIGGAVARAFAGAGAHVYLAGRTRARLEAVANDIGDAADVAEVDALDEHAVAEHADAVAADVGGIDIALNAVSFPHVSSHAPLRIAQATYALADPPPCTSRRFSSRPPVPASHDKKETAND